MTTERAVNAFYGVVLATALAGSTTAAANWLDVPWWVAVAPIAAVELGGVVLSMHADERRRLGERAIAARTLSAVLALMAIAVNVFGHDDHVGLAAFFGGLSAIGYCVYLLIASARRRDALRKAGKLEDTTPVYGLVQWIRHPVITRRARILAQANAAARLLEGDEPTTPRLGRLASLDAAREQLRAEKRNGAIAEAVRDLIRASADPLMAKIAEHTYDPDEIATRVAARADYDGYAALLSERLTPARLAAPASKPLAIEAPPVPAVTAAPARQDETPIDIPLDDWTVTGDRQPDRQSTVTAAVPMTVIPTVTATVSDPSPAPAKKAVKRTVKKPSRGRQISAAEKVAAAVEKLGADASNAALMKAAGVSESSVLRHRPKPAAVNGHNHPES